MQHPQTNGICERFHKTLLNEFYRVAFRKKFYRNLDEIQQDLDAWIVEYQHQPASSGPLVLRQNPDADLCRQCAVGQRETDRMTSGLIVTVRSDVG